MWAKWLIEYMTFNSLNFDPFYTISYLIGEFSKAMVIHDWILEDAHKCMFVCVHVYVDTNSDMIVYVKKKSRKYI